MNSKGSGAILTLFYLKYETCDARALVKPCLSCFTFVLAVDTRSSTRYQVAFDGKVNTIGFGAE